MKFLIAISPTGAIIFVSKCWGGQVSDKYLTSQSGFLDHLVPGDMVLADRGFDIADELALYGASFAIPPFTRGKDQLSQREVETAVQRNNGITFDFYVTGTIYDSCLYLLFIIQPISAHLE